MIFSSQPSISMTQVRLKNPKYFPISKLLPKRILDLSWAHSKTKNPPNIAFTTQNFFTS